MTSQPLVTVIVPAYNAAPYLKDALDSIFAQSHPAVEVVVVNDGSTDGTDRMIESFGSRITAIHQERRGIGGARNTGVNASHGELLAFLDADDLYLTGKLERQVAALERQPTLAMVFGHVEEFVSDELSADDRARLLVRQGPRPGYLAQTMLVRREPFHRVGPFGDWRSAEFLDWYLKAIDIGLQAAMLNDVVLRRRLHLTNVGRVERQSRSDFARVLKASLDRRRAGESAHS